MGVKEREFPIEVVLTITHDKLMCKIDDVYDILNFITRDSLYTHQLPRAADYASKVILKQHPQLRDWDFHCDKVNEHTWQDYVEKARELFGSSLKIRQDDSNWERKGPITEMIEILERRKKHERKGKN